MNATSRIPTSFSTGRLLVRRYRHQDEAVLFEAARASIAQVFTFLPWCHPDYAMEDARSWLASVEPNWIDGSTYSFGIFSHDESEFYGGCGISQIDEHPVGNLGYWIKSGATGRGIATEATVGLARFSVSHLEMQRIEIIMSVENTASMKVAKRAGAQCEGRLRNRLLLHGRCHDAFLYSLTPEDLHNSGI